MQQSDSLIASDIAILNFEGASVVDNGGNKVTVTMGATSQIFYGYDSTGGSAITTTSTVLNIDTAPLADAAYTLTNDVITFNQAGVYRVIAHMTAEAQNSGAQRSSVQFRAEKDTGGGFVNVPGALCQDYMRRVNPSDSSVSCSFSFFDSFSIGDQLRFSTQSLNSTGSQTVSGGSGVTIEFIR